MAAQAAELILLLSLHTAGVWPFRMAVKYDDMKQENHMAPHNTTPTVHT